MINCLKLYTSSIMVIALAFMGCTTVYTHPNKDYAQTTHELNDCAVEAKWRCEELKATKMPDELDQNLLSKEGQKTCVEELTNQCMTEGLGYQQRKATFGIISGEPSIQQSTSYSD